MSIVPECLIFLANHLVKLFLPYALFPSYLSTNDLELPYLLWYNNIKLIPINIIVIGIANDYKRCSGSMSETARYTNSCKKKGCFGAKKKK